ncbi:unnamed protein product [Miscanthus lutarioriparius]|uniref:Uncharacterized protein n=1 Tax=Miscanthus lutarioriparius TaxID=422564 RepID=A0A811S3C2_9POAL|nr:unnamed protein product [Miscanthus lutarioriparius]
MATSSPLPRWAATPSPSRPLFASSSTAAGGGSRVLPPFGAVLAALRGRGSASLTGEAQPPPPPPLAGAMGGLPSGFDGIDHLDGPMMDGIVCRDGGMFTTWENIWVTARGRRQGEGHHHSARRQRQRAPWRGAGHHGTLRVWQDHTARHLGR